MALIPLVESRFLPRNNQKITILYLMIENISIIFRHINNVHYLIFKLFFKIHYLKMKYVHTIFSNF